MADALAGVNESILATQEAYQARVSAIDLLERENAAQAERLRLAQDELALQEKAAEVQRKIAEQQALAVAAATQTPGAALAQAEAYSRTVLGAAAAQTLATQAQAEADAARTQAQAAAAQVLWGLAGLAGLALCASLGLGLWFLIRDWKHAADTRRRQREQMLIEGMWREIPGYGLVLVWRNQLLTAMSLFGQPAVPAQAAGRALTVNDANGSHTLQAILLTPEQERLVRFLALCLELAGGASAKVPSANVMQQRFGLRGQEWQECVDMLKPLYVRATERGTYLISPRFPTLNSLLEAVRAGLVFPALPADVLVEAV